MTVREIAKLARHIIKTHPEFYPLFSEREFTWNKIRQQNRNPLINTCPASTASCPARPRKASTAWSRRCSRAACG